MSKLKRKRNRGVVLTAVGLQKLHEAKNQREHQENWGKRYTYEKISELTSLDISTVKKVLNNREGVDKKTLAKLCSAFDLDLVEELYTKPNSRPDQDWGEAVAVEHFCGRNQELNTLSNWIIRDRCRTVVLQGMGGIGKTTLSIELAKKIGSHFNWTVWKSLRDAPPVEEVVTYLIEFLSQGQETIANLPTRLGAKISRLISYLRSDKCLIVLDNVESLLDEGTRAGKYRAEYAGYSELIQRIGSTEHNSCIVLTTREKSQEIAMLEGERLPVRSLRLGGLKESTEILKVKGLSGSDSELKALRDRYNGNPLALKVVATTIKDLFAGNILEFLRQEKAVFGDIRDLLDRQFSRLSDLEQEIMYWLAIIREPVSWERLQSNFVFAVSPIALLEALESLSRRSLIEKQAALFTQQSVVMEYLTRRLIEAVCQEISDRQPRLLRSHTLVKATAKDFIRANQIRLILQPVINELLSTGKNQQDLERCLYQMLQTQQQTSLEPGYTAGNIINLLCHLQVDLTGSDFSNLSIWQADLRLAKLHLVNFARCDLSKTAFAENFGGIWSVAFSPDGQYLAIGDTKGNILLRRVIDSQLIRKLEGHGGWVVALEFSPNGRLLASSSSDGTARLWEVETGRCLQCFSEHQQEVWSVVFSPDGQTLATGCDDGLIRIWQVATGECLQVFSGHESEVLTVAFTHDGQKLLSGSQDSTVRLWDLKSGATELIFRGHEDGIRSISMSPDGRIVASGSSDRTIRLWQIETGACIQILKGHANVVLAVTFSPQANLLASSSIGQKVRLWNLQTGECLRVFQGHANVVNAIAFNPPGDILASGSCDQTVKLWDVHNYQCLKTWQGYSNQSLCVTFSPDGQTIVSGGHDHKVRIWDVASGQILQTLHQHNNSVFGVALNPHNGLLASGSGDQTVKLWNIATGKTIQTLEGHQAVVRAIAFRADGKLLASGSEDLTIKLWEIPSGRCTKTLKGHQAEVWSVCFAPQIPILASASFDSTIKLWDVATGQCLGTLKGHKSWVWSLAFSPQDRDLLVSTSADQTIRLWNLQTGESQIILPDNGHSQLIAWSVDGQLIACCDRELNIRLWQIDTGKCSLVLKGHQAAIDSIAFSPDGSTLVSSSADETIRLWDLDRGECLKILTIDKPYQLMNITGVKGLSPVTINTLKALGAIVK